MNTKTTVINVARFCTDDGPGIRTTVFLKGCPLSCLWCHNPESQSACPELLYQAEKCTGCGRCAAVCPTEAHRITADGHSYDRTLCTDCGACAGRCPAAALELIGREMSAEEVFAEVVRDAVFYKTSGGGVTVSGGEPLSHPAFTASLLGKCREAGIHTAIETSGFASPDALSRVIPHCDLVLFDIKETDPVRHERFTGVPLAPILENLRWICAQGVPVILRLPIIPGLNDREEHLLAAGALAASLDSVQGAEVMPYHLLGAYKYKALGREYTLADVREPDTDTIGRWRDLLENADTKKGAF